MGMVNFFAKKESSGDASHKAPDFRSYVDPTHEFESKDLARSMWFVRHEVLLYKLFFWFAVAVAVLTWGYTIFKLGDYVIFGITYDKQLDQSAVRFINYTPLKAKYSPKPLENVSSYFLPSGTNKADAITEVRNPNASWYTTFTYRFLTGLATSTEFNVTIPPGQTVLLTTLGLSEEASDPTLQISNQTWRRVSPHDVPDPLAFVAEHYNFEVSNFVFTPAGTGPGVASSARVAFTFANNSPYSYQSPYFIIGFYRNEALVGAAPLKLDSFDSLQKVPVDVRSFTPNLIVDSVVVYPLINLFDPASYVLKPKN